MKITKQKVRVKVCRNDESTYSYDTTLLHFKDIEVFHCACGGRPKISQVQEGTPFHDYTGEDFLIGCSSCKLSFPNILVYIPGQSNSKILAEMKLAIRSLVIKWNLTFLKEAKTTIHFTTDKK